MFRIYPNIYLFIIVSLFANVVYGQNTPGYIKGSSATAAPIPDPYASPTINYRRTWQAMMPAMDTATIASPLRRPEEVQQVTEYYDDLGRLIQTVSRGTSGQGRDVVAPILYDEFGRQQYNYLPYVPLSGNTNDGKFKTDPFNAQKDFYLNKTYNPAIQGEKIYYNEIEFEQSPLNRVLYKYGAGNNWSKNSGHAIQHQYQFNTIDDSVRIFTLSNDNMAVTTGIYDAGELYKNTIVDENGSQVIEFKDKDDRLVLRKVQAVPTPSKGHIGWLCTYYVYDDLSNIRFVIPPLAVEKINPNWNVSNIAYELCFQYRFDSRNRMIMKKIPGADSTEMVYDIRDRLVFSRDGNMKKNGASKWLVIFYDNLNRQVETAFYTSSASRSSLQSMMDKVNPDGNTSYQFPGVADLVIAVDDRNTYVATNSINIENGFDTGDNTNKDFLIDPSLNNGITNISVSNPLPNINPQELYPLTYTYYEDYNFPGVSQPVSGDLSKPEAGTNPYAEPVKSVSGKTHGMVTGIQTRILDSNQWLTTTTYYNDKGKPIQVISDNPSGGKDITTTLYDFNEKVLSTYLRHTNLRSGITPETRILTSMIYDGAGRLSSIRKRLNDNSTLERAISSLEYDELGRLKNKTLGVISESQAIEQLSYEYNIRGWLTTINKDYLNNGNAISHFGMELSYDDGFKEKTFNGNIAGTRWKGWNDPKPRALGFYYDNSNRLTQADFTQQNTSGGQWAQDEMNFSVTGIGYDANGNITRMAQKGSDGPKNNPLIDRLAYTYLPNSNKLITVYDSSSVTSRLGDFKNGTNTENDYDYDFNGNLTKDLNKSITSISYNHLNLPVQINFTNKGNISYQYDAVGHKIQKTVTDITTSPARITTTSYINGFVYRNDTLEFASHEEGRVRLFYKTNTAPEYVYDYFIKDHLGNTRMVLTEKNNFAVYTATMESGTAVKEAALFSNIDATRTPRPVGYPSDESSAKNEFVAKLSAKDGGKKIGPSIVLRVMAGDTIQIGAKAFYKSQGPQNKNNPELPAENLIADLLQAFGGSNTSLAEHNTGAVNNQTPFNTNFYNNDYRKLKEKNPDENTPEKPRAYLNFVLFDDQFNLVQENSGVKQVKGEPDQLQTLATDKLPITKSGFLYVYTSNETTQDVFFDNLVITQATGKVLEETHYYPFGLTMAGISYTAFNGGAYPENRKKYNGNELQSKEFADGSGLEWYDFNARTYDAQTGRFMQIDPLIESGNQERLTPYQFSFNDPIRHNDPDGKFPIWGAIVGAAVEGGFELASQLASGKSLKEVDWADVGVEAVKGAITGSGAGVIWRAVSDVGGEIVKAAVDVSQKDGVQSVANERKSGKDFAIDFSVGYVGGKLGGAVANQVSKATGKMLRTATREAIATGRVAAQTTRYAGRTIERTGGYGARATAARQAIRNTTINAQNANAKKAAAKVLDATAASATRVGAGAGNSMVADGLKNEENSNTKNNKGNEF